MRNLGVPQATCEQTGVLWVSLLHAKLSCRYILIKIIIIKIIVIIIIIAIIIIIINIIIIKNVIIINFNNKTLTPIAAIRSEQLAAL